MKLPLMIVSFLPKKWQNDYVQHVWDSKTDKSIIHAYDDCMGWICFSRGMSCDGTASIASRCEDKLEKYINPQMKKRGIVSTITENQ